MRKIEAIIEVEEVGEVREALRELGIRTMRLADVRDEGVVVDNEWIGRSPEIEPAERPRTRISVVVPDDLADRVMLTLLMILKGGDINDGENPISSIQQVVRMETAGLFDGVV